MNNLEGKKVIIIGAGISGLTATIALQQLGMRVRIYEKADSLRTTGTGLSVMANAIAALKTIGVNDIIEAAGQPIRIFEIKNTQGKTITTFPLDTVGKELGAENVNIHRQRLHNALLSKVEGDVIELNKSFESYTQNEDEVKVKFTDGSTLSADLLLGADGFNSAVREQLAGKTEIQTVPYVAWLATTPIKLPQFEAGYVCHYWGQGRRFGLIDIGHDEYYWWGTKNVASPSVYVKSNSKKEVLDTYQGWSPEISTVINATKESDILKVHTCDRKTLSSWTEGRVALIGDAAHAMLTSLGQGAAQGIVDAAVLADCLKHSTKVSLGLKQYEDVRLSKANSVVRLARSLSAIEQLDNRLLIALRNLYFKWTPQSVFEKQNRDILSFSLPSAQ